MRPARSMQRKRQLKFEKLFERRRAGQPGRDASAPKGSLAVTAGDSDLPGLTGDSGPLPTPVCHDHTLQRSLDMADACCEPGQPRQDCTGISQAPPTRREEGFMPNIESINRFLQARLGKTRREDVCAVEAASWLDEAGLLSDRPERPGQPLRRLLRKRLVAGQERRPRDSRGRVWWIAFVGLSDESRS